ncbi:unnamed protein product [Closterium sp. NIES-53]
MSVRFLLLLRWKDMSATRKGAVEKRGAPTPSGDSAGKGAGEKRGAPSQVAVATGLLWKTKADSAAQLGIAGRPFEPVGKRPSSVLGDVSLSEPGSPPPGPRPRSPSASKKRLAVTKSTKRAAEATESSDVEMASTVVVARHEKSKKPKVIGYASPPPPDDQGKTRGCKAPFKGPGMARGEDICEDFIFPAVAQRGTRGGRISARSLRSPPFAPAGFPLRDFVFPAVA